jgi:hypothetical protein
VIRAQARFQVEPGRVCKVQPSRHCRDADTLTADEIEIWDGKMIFRSVRVFRVVLGFLLRSPQ